MKNARAFCFLLLITLFSLFHIYAQEENTESLINDLCKNEILLRPYIDAGMQNIAIGGSVGLQVRNLGPFLLNASVGMSGFSNLILGNTNDTSFYPMLGTDNLKARLGAAIAISRSTETVSTFQELGILSQDSHSTTYYGFYIDAPYHNASYVGAEVWLEANAVYKQGYSEDTLNPSYTVEEGYSLYLVPKYTFINEWHYNGNHKGYKVDNAGMLLFSSLFFITPDLTQGGLGFDFQLDYQLASVIMNMDLMIGAIGRWEVPEGSLINNEESGFINAIYMPYRITFGITFPIYIGTSEAAK